MLRVLAVVLALVSLAFGYCYVSGQVLLLSSDIHAKIELNGALVPGEILVGRTTAVVTVRETGKRHSYQLFFAGDTDLAGNMGFVVDCGAWVAPHLPVLPETRNYSPCRMALHEASHAELWPLINKGSSMQFTLQDNSTVAISRSRY